MVEKRLLKKLPLIKAEIDPPSVHGSDKPDVVIVGWGSTYGVMKEAVEELSARNVAMLHFSELYPFPEYAKIRLPCTPSEVRRRPSASKTTPWESLRRSCGRKPDTRLMLTS